MEDIMIRAGRMSVHINEYRGAAGSVIQAGQMDIVSARGIKLEVGCKFIFPNGKEMSINRECTIKEFHFDGSMHIVQMDGSEHSYSVENYFEYPDGAEAHLLGAGADFVAE